MNTMWHMACVEFSEGEFALPYVNTASIGYFFSFLTVMQHSPETKVEGLKKHIHKWFVCRHNVLGYMMLKMYEVEINVSEKQKWQDTAGCKYFTKDDCVGISFFKRTAALQNMMVCSIHADLIWACFFRN